MTADARRVGRYRLDRPLGGGEHSEVWAGVDERLGRPVAVKVLHGATAADHGLRERFLREATAVARVDHPGIAPVFDGGLIDGELLLVMPLVAGEQLADRLAVGPLPPAEAVAVVEQLAAALGAAGDAGLVHSDVKPTNVLLSPAVGAGRPFHVTLVDFGISVEAGTGEAAGATVDYAAPEQLQGGVLDTRTDVYGLGCLAHELLTGRPPFSPPGASPEQVRAAHLRDQPPAASRQHPELGTRFDAVLARALAKDPAARFAEPAELAAALAQAARTPLAPPAPAPTGPGRRLVVAAIALAVLGLGALGVALLRNDDHEAAPPPSSVPPASTAAPVVTGPPASAPAELRGAYVVSASGEVVAVGTTPGGSDDGDGVVVPAGGDGSDPAVGLVPTDSGGGFWLVRRSGAVQPYGDADDVGAATEVATGLGLAPPGPIVAVVARQPGGFWVIDAAGVVVPYLGARAPASAFVLPGDRLTAAAGNPVGDGFWAIGRIQSVYSIGAGLIADLTGACPSGVEAVAAAATPTGEGLWLVDSGGQVTACGDAAPLPGLPADVAAQQGVVAAVAAPSGRGLVLLDAVGRTFPVGDAPDLPDAALAGNDPAVALVAAG